ncbi:AAA family ATPase [Vibrio cyclitrophicus]|uniref:AAA family ATPase n=1 Tax=Vibrio cyclitrophicus TaxID=47951 RepID=UPI0030DC4649
MIENFRGITFAVIDVDDFTTLVGRNNIGKSTILSAIRIALNTSHPTLDDWPNKACSEEPMRITCEFGDIQEWEKRKSAISQLMDDENLKIRMEGIWTEEGGSPAYKYYVHNEKITTPFDGVKITAARKDEFLSTVLAALDIKDAADYNQRLGEIEQYVIENHEDKVERSTGWHEKSFANSLQQAIPHVMYVPASFRIE